MADSCVTFATAKEQFEETLGKPLADDLLAGLNTRKGGSRRWQRRRRGGGRTSYVTIVVLLSAILGVGLCMVNHNVVENVVALKRSMGDNFLPLLHQKFFGDMLNVTGKAHLLKTVGEKLDLLNTVGEKLGKYAVGIKKGGFTLKTVAPASVEAFLELIEQKGGAAQAETVLRAPPVETMSARTISQTFLKQRPLTQTFLKQRPLTHRSLSLTRRTRGRPISSTRSHNSNLFELHGDTLLIKTSPPLQISVKR